MRNLNSGNCVFVQAPLSAILTEKREYFNTFVTTLCYG